MDTLGGGEDVRSTRLRLYTVDKQGSWKALTVLVVPSLFVTVV